MIPLSYITWSSDVIYALFYTLGKEKAMYALERDAAKAAISALNNEAALQYVEALEAVARAAYETWKNTPHASKPTVLTVSCLGDLYDALAVVNFMSDEP